jgi:hypothetical protein
MPQVNEMTNKELDDLDWDKILQNELDHILETIRHTDRFAGAKDIFITALRVAFLEGRGEGIKVAAKRAVELLDEAVRDSKKAADLVTEAAGATKQ